MAGGAGCQLLGLRATRLIERDLLLALKASFEVVGGLAVASQIDLRRQAAILYGLARAGLVDPALRRADRLGAARAQIEQLVGRRRDNAAEHRSGVPDPGV